MDRQIRILILEDNTSDAELMQCELRKSGLNFTTTLAPDRNSFLNALDKFIPDIILAEYSLAGFDGLSALRLARERFSEIPVIVVSGVVAEETAIETLKAGATDYVLKEGLGRLSAAVQRALRRYEQPDEKWHVHVEEAFQKSHTESTASEGRFRALIENSADAVSIIEPSGALRYISPNVAAMFGYLPWEMEGRDGFSFVHPDDMQRCQEALEEIIREPGTLRRLEVRGRHKDGSWRWLYIIAKNLLVDPAIAGIVVTISDISERKHLEEELRKVNEELEVRVKKRTEEVLMERQRLYNVLETLPAYVVLLDKDYRVPFANKFFRERFGESHGRRCYEYLFKRNDACENCETYKVMKTNAPHHWEWTGPDGRNYDIYDFPFIDTDGSMMILEMGIDITERKQAEAQLKKHQEHLGELVKERTEDLSESEQRLSRSQAIAHLGSWELDLLNNRLTWSDEVYRIFGLKPQEFGATYEAFLGVVHPDDRKAVDEVYSGSIHEGRDSYEIEHRVVRKSTGEIRYVHEKCEHIRDKTGKIIRSVGMVHDITERKKAEEALKQNEALLSVSLQAASAGSWDWDFVTGKLVWSKEYYELCGLRPETLKPTLKNWLKSIYPQDRSRVRQEVEVALRRRRRREPLLNTEFRIDHPQKGLRWLSAKGEIFCDKTGKPLRMAGIAIDVTAQKSSEEKIKHLASFPQNNPNPIIEVDVHGKVVFSNLAAIKALKELKATDKISLFFPEDLKGVIKTLRLNKKEIYSREVTIKDSVFLETLAVLPELNTVRIYAQDITQLKKAEEALKEARDTLEIKVQQRTEELLDTNRQLIGEILERKDIEKQIRIRGAILKIMGRTSNCKEYLDILIRYIKSLAGCRYCGIRVLNEQGRIPYESYLGFSRGFWRRENWLSIRKDQCACIRVITGKALPQDRPCMSKSGSFVSNDIFRLIKSLTEKEKALFRGVCMQSGFHSVAVIPINYKNEVIAAIHLADERKEMVPQPKIEFLEQLTPLIGEGIHKFNIEDRVRRTSQRVANILESLTDGFFALNRDWRFTYVNSAAERIVGVKREDLLGKVMWEVFPKAKSTKIYEEFLRCMMQRTPVSFEALSLYSNTWMETYVYPSEEGISVYFRDISEKKLRAEELKEVQKQLERTKRLSDIGTLAAIVAHELRNPLAAMRIASYNIKRKAQNPQLEKHLFTIDKKISESDQIINNLLFYSRLKKPYFENVDIYNIMNECFEIVEKRSVKSEVLVRKKYRALRPMFIDADPLQMKELFGNILNNAYDAMHEKSGAIEINVKHAAADITISIKDTGVGMDEEHLRRAREPFFTTKAKGTGLGLTVCYQIVDLHEGKLELASEKGKGTTVTVTLPKKRPHIHSSQGSDKT